MNFKISVIQIQQVLSSGAEQNLKLEFVLRSDAVPFKEEAILNHWQHFFLTNIQTIKLQHLVA